MEETITYSIAGIIALMWTIFQQWQISKMCKECPLRIEYIEKKEKKALPSKA